MQTGEIIKALEGLTEDDPEKIIEEASQILAEMKTSARTNANALQQMLLNGPVMADDQYKEFLESRNSFRNAGATEWPDDHVPNSLLSPEDEKNVRRIWKSPGGC